MIFSCSIRGVMLAAVLLAASSERSAAQAYYTTGSGFSLDGIGIMTGISKPLGNFGAEFKTAPSFELYLESSGNNPRFKANLSFLYANYKPRLDTLPVYMVEGSSMMSYKLYPGKLAYQDARNMLLFFDYSYAVIRKGKFDLSLGGGMGIGKMWYNYYLEYENILRLDQSKEDFTAAFRAQSNLTYKLHPYVRLRATFAYQWQTFTDWSVKFPTRNIGIGLVFHFNPDDEDE